MVVMKGSLTEAPQEIFYFSETLNGEERAQVLLKWDLLVCETLPKLNRPYGK